MHEVPRGLTHAAEKAGATFRFGTPVERITRRADGSVRGVRLETGEILAADAVVCNVDVAVAYRSLLGLTPPLVAGRGRYSPSCIVWLAGVRGALPAGAAHHNIHFGRSLARGVHGTARGRPPDARPVDPGDVRDARPIRRWHPTGRPRCSRSSPRPTSTGAWTGQPSGRACATSWRPGSATSATRSTTSWSSGSPIRATGRRRDSSGGHRSPWRTASSRPVRSGRATSTAGIPGLVFTGMGTVPGVGIPMVLISGRLAADRIDEWAGSRRPRR